MPFSQFRGTGRGGFTPPVDSIRRGGFTLNRFTVNGFTVNPSSLRVNGFTPPLATGRGGFIPPVDALWHGRSRKPFRICTYKKCARKCCGICTYKSLDLNFPGINTYKKQGVGGTPSFASFASSASFTSFCLLASLPRIARDAIRGARSIAKREGGGHEAEQKDQQGDGGPDAPLAIERLPAVQQRRSEERRVGKECRL